MSSIKDKLQRLDRSPAIRSESCQTENPATGKWITDFQMELGASVLEEKNSFIILKENYFPLYKNSSYNNLQEANYFLPHFHYISGDPRTRDWNLRKTLFIDLETTGLSGMSGCC